MAFRYVVKKRMVGIGTKTEKYVAASYSVANIDFDRLCDQVTSQGMVPRGIVKAVLDGMIDALCTYASIGATVRLGDFGSLRPGLNGKSQEDAKSVTADVVYRQKLIFVPGQRLKNMMKQSGITRLVTGSEIVPPNVLRGIPASSFSASFSIFHFLFSTKNQFGSYSLSRCFLCEMIS